MKKHLHLKKVLVALLTIVAVMVGHQAMAASKTVTYTFTVAFDSSNPNRCTLTFTPSNSGFGYSTGRKTVTILDVSSTTGFTVQLDDGLQLTYSQDQGRMTFGDYNSINLNWPNTGGNSRLTLGSSHYYVTHVKLAMPNGNNVLVGQAIPWTGANAQLDVDVDMVTETDGLVNFRTFSATFSDPQVFGQFTVTYGDSPRDYTITYNDAVNGQNGVTNNNPTTYNVTTNTFSVTAPTRTGYDFVRFTYTDAQQSNPIQPTLPHVISRGDAATRKAITFNAQWTPNTYTVTLDNQSATNPGTASVTATYDAAMPAITVPTKTGYTFGGYYTATNGGGTQYYNADGTSAHNWDIASETTLYAQWTANTYTVTLDNQSATNPGTTSVTATYDAAMPAITVPTKTGYTFGGYYTETNGGGTKYYNANGTSAHNWDIASATTLYAQWNVIPWTGGGTTENDPFVILYASQLIKLSNDVNGGNKYNGNFFKLGNDIDMSGVAFDGIGNSISRCFRGTFDGDGKIVSNVIVNRSEYENVGFFGYVSSGGAVKNLILDGVSIAGDQRVGVLVGYGYYCSIENCLVMNSSVTSNWSYRGVICGKPDEATLNGNHYRNCTCNNTQTTNIGVGNFGSTDVDGARSVHTLTLPEQVSVASATESVTYDEVTYYASTSTVTFNYNDVHDGYMPTYSATAGTVSGNTLTMPAEDVTITVSLVAITYNIAYDLAGGSVATANPNTYNIETETFTLNNPTREGYTFAGWTGTDLDEQTMTVTIAQGSTGDRSYTATWSTDAYTITYDLAGGSVATANPTTYTVETPTFTLNNPTKVACNFDGWTGSNGDTPETTVTIAQGSTGDRSYTAQWTQYAFTLSLGTDITASGTVAFTYEGTDYYAVGTEITLAYGGTIPEGYRPLYSVNGNAIVGNTFEMPTADVVVDAVLLERYYTRHRHRRGELHGRLLPTVLQFHQLHEHGPD